MANASKDPIALISVRPAIFHNVNSSEGPSRATNRIGTGFAGRFGLSMKYDGAETEGSMVVRTPRRNQPDEKKREIERELANFVKRENELIARGVGARRTAWPSTLYSLRRETSN